MVKSGQKRVGFSVNKKVGVAVVRNHTKRRLRECVRPLLPEMKNGLYVFVARPSAAECTFEQLNRSVRMLMQRLEALHNQERRTDGDRS